MPKPRPGSAKNGDKIRFHYSVRFLSGMVVNSTFDKAPVEMVLGKGLAVPGLEKALKGMLPGEKKTVEVKAPLAFGTRREDLMIPSPRSHFPDREFQIGQPIEFTQPNGDVVKGRVRLVDDVMVIFDLNHPLAGHDLIYDVQLVQVLS